MTDIHHPAIAIVGVGAVLPDAPTATHFWDNVKGGHYSIQEVPDDRWDPELFFDPDPKAPAKTYSKIGGWVQDWEWNPIGWRLPIPPKVADAMDLAQKWAVAGTRQALADYGYPSRPLNSERTAVILGNAMAGDQHYLTAIRIFLPEYELELARTESFSQLEPALQDAIRREFGARVAAHFPEITEDSMPGELGNIIAGRVANLFDFHGPNFVTDAACASAMAAIGAAMEGLNKHDFDAVITGGIDSNMSASTFTKFCKIGALSATGTRPFAEGADGFVMGEGAAVFILKRLADAVRDDDSIYALIRGVGGSSDGRGKGITAPNPRGQRLAVERAWQRAGVAPDAATLIEGHGTSTRVGDVVEVESLTEAFRPFRLLEGCIPLGSVKSNIGHLKGAAGAAGLLKSALALRDRVLPPSLGCQTPNPKIDFANCPFRVNTELREWEVENGGVRRVGTSAFGFGGTNFHVVLEEYRPGESLESARSIHVGGVVADHSVQVSSVKEPLRGALMIGGGSEADLTQRLQGELRKVRAGEGLEPRPPQSSDLTAPFRLAIDFDSAEDLIKKSTKALTILESGRLEAWKPLRARGVFFGQGPAPKIAMLFTGQGSQYLNMLRELRHIEPIVAETFDRADAIMTPLLGRPLTEYLFIDDQDPEVVAVAEDSLRQTSVTQPAVLTVDIALTNLMAAYGIHPDFVMGHSLGEYGALVAAGSMDFRHALEAVSARGAEMMKLSVEDSGGMAAVFAPLNEIERILETVDGYVVVANINSPSEAVLGGGTPAIWAAVTALNQAGFDAKPLPVSHAFHTAIVAPVSGPLRTVLEKMDLRPPNLPVISNVSGEFYPMGPGVEPEMVELLARQVARPVQFVNGLETLYRAGARVFIEMGPKRALQGMVRGVFQDRDDVLALSTNHPRLGDTKSFNQALCGLWAAGVGLGIEAQPIDQSKERAPRPALPPLMEARSSGEVSSTPPSRECSSSVVPPGESNTYLQLGKMFADVLERGMELYSGGQSAVPETPVVITGASLGLPGTERVFDDRNVERLLSGQQFIRPIPSEIRDAMVSKNITRLVKTEQGGPHFETIDSTADVIKLAARAGGLDLVEEFGYPADREAALDIVTQLAIGAGLDALRDAGIPLVRRYKTTSKGTHLPDSWGLPAELRDDTGVIFASAFPGVDFFASETRKHYQNQSRRELLAELVDLRETMAASGSGEYPEILSQRIDQAEAELAANPYSFDRRFLFKLLAMGHSQFAELIGARGPNTQINGACASGTQAITLAEDWIRAGRCRRVVVISADNVTSDEVLGWIGAGFLASGAAATDEKVEDAAIPFDRRRHGMIIGMGAASLVVETREAASERGLEPICEVLSSITANSAFHGTRLDVEHISQVMESLIRQAETKWGLDRYAIAPETVFISHETYTPARGGSAQAEIFALRRVFGTFADKIVIANTKGYTGHPMAVAMEEVLAVKSLETGLVPPVANIKEIDPELGNLNLSRGGDYPVRYALRLGAGFGSQISMSLLQLHPSHRGRRPGLDELGYAFRVVDDMRWQGWLDRVSGYPRAHLETHRRTLRVQDEGPPTSVPTSVVDPVPQVVADLQAPTSEPASPPPAVTPQAAPFSTIPAGTEKDPVALRILELVAEMTGYPEDMLDLDLDMEADLGIDTVKQAEMFAAIREEWNIPRDENLQLRDFPTLAHSIQFVYDRRPDLLSSDTAAGSQTEEKGPSDESSSSALRSKPVDGQVPRRVPKAVLRPALDLCKATSVGGVEGSRVVVMPDEGGVGVALARDLDRRGAEVLLVEGTPDFGDLRRQLESWLAQGAVDGVYWLPALDTVGVITDLSPAEWAEALEIRVKLMHTAMQVLYESFEKEGTFLIAGTRMGGRHGYDLRGALSPLGGAVSGFSKTLKRERPQALVKVVDFAVDETSAKAAAALIDETLQDPGVVEVGYAEGHRWTVGLVEEPLNSDGPEMELADDPVFVVTGAAGSIVSAIVSDLAGRWPGHFYLLDLTAEPAADDPDLELYRHDRESLKRKLFERLKQSGEKATPANVERRLAAFERSQSALAALAAVGDAGGEGHYRSVDLLDAQAVAEVVGEIQARHGRIDVLVHAAGMEISHMLPNKSRQEFDLIFDVKAQGWFHLLKSAGDMPIGSTVVFTSIAGRFGNAGQTDYSSANDLLCKLTSNLRSSRPATRGIAIDWSAWAEIGMASRGSIPKMMEQAGIDMVPPAIGIPLVGNEIARSPGEEIVVAGSLGGLLEEWDETGGLDSQTLEPRQEGALVMKGLVYGQYGGLSAEIDLDPRSQPFLFDHQIEGTAVLPGVMGVEAFAEISRMVLPEWCVIGIEEMRFLAPFKFYRDEPRKLLVKSELQTDGDDVISHCRLIGRRSLAKGERVEETLHFTGKVRLAKRPRAAEFLSNLPSIPKEVLEHDAIYELYFHGPAYQVLGAAWRSGDRVVGSLSADLPDHHQPVDRRTIAAPRLAELCFQTAGLIEFANSERVGLPRRVEQIRLFDPIEERAGLRAIVERTGSGDYSATVVDEAGIVLLEMTGYATIESPMGIDEKPLRELRRVLTDSQAGSDS